MILAYNLETIVLVMLLVRLLWLHPTTQNLRVGKQRKTGSGKQRK